MLEVWLNTFIILFIIGSITITANLADRKRELRPLVYAAILGMNGLLVIFPLLAAVASVIPVEDSVDSIIIDTPGIENKTPGDSENTESEITAEVEKLDAGDIIPAVMIAILGAAITILFMRESVRRWTAQFFPEAPLKKKNTISDDLPLIGVIHEGEIENEVLPEAAFTVDPETGFRPESMVHLWAGVLMIQFLAFQLMSFFLSGGLSGLAEDIGVSYGILIANFIPIVLVPLLGVGLFTR
ncbi:MAG TPA: hypothetical protein VJZ27_10315, partial [Aggregatilineales bacterium]|nr:hypothetical protein [Aggregatilineales bacterium]